MSNIKSILVVEDEVLMCDVIVLQLEEEGYIVYDAFNGKEGLEKYIEHKPDLVLSDIRMPIMDGVEMMQEILKINPDASVILLSGYTDHPLEDLKTRGAKAFLDKPFNFERLKEEIEKF